MRTAYYGNWLLLPKTRFNIPSLMNALTYPLRSRDRIVGFVHAYKEDETYFHAPREFYTEQFLQRLSIDLKYQLPEKYPKVQFSDSILLDALDPASNMQRKAFAALKSTGHGVLSLACGRGKTVVALKYAAALRRPVLVIVETTALVTQWAVEAQEKLGLKDSQIGRIQGPPDSWTADRPFVLATIQSLALHADSLSESLCERFGLVIWDEVHHLAAPYYNKTAALFPGLRLGLSATPERSDGLEGLYLAHMGNIFYLDHTQDLVPAVNFHEVDLGVDWGSEAVLDEILDRTGELSWTRLWGYLGNSQKYVDEAVDLVLKAVSQGRKILVLSGRLHTVKKVNDALNASQGGLSDVITSKTKQENRIHLLRNSQVTVAITRIAREGLDEPSLDTLVMMEPTSDANILRQTVGRILRSCATKKHPEVHVMVAKTDPCIRMMYAMRKNFNSWPRKPKMRFHK